jgi:IS30 family transposase
MDAIAEALNTRPRKSLGFLSPIEVLFDFPVVALQI